MPTAAVDLEDLRAPIFDVRKDQYLYQQGKDVHINSVDPSA